MALRSPARAGHEKAQLRTLFWLVVPVLVFTAFASLADAATEAPERIAWQKTPIAIELTVGTERLVHFPGPVKVGMPPQLQGVVRVQSIAGTTYLLAHQPFADTRVIVQGLDDGRVYVLDVSAKAGATNNAPIRVFLPDEEQADGEDPQTTAQYGYVTLTRFAAQQLYAPARLLKALPGVVRMPVTGERVDLVRGDVVDAVPLIAWRANDLYLTAVRLTNKTDRPHILDPRTLRGRWLSAAFQHNRLHSAGSEADRTVVYLISARPFGAAL